jgi:D-ribulokinase
VKEHVFPAPREERALEVTEAVLGIDVGTSGVRIAARGRDGALLAMAQAPMVRPPADIGRTVQNPLIWWETVVQAFASLDVSGLQILALAIDGTSGTILPIDGAGKAVGMGSMYNDMAEPQLVQGIAAVAPAETAALGGTSPLARAMMMPANVSRIVHQADWLSARFSGVFDVTDENNALKSGYDPVRRDWPAWIAKTGFDVRKFPRVVAAGTRTGTITAMIADQFKLPHDVAVVAGTTDGCAAFLASGAAEAGDGVTSLGTTLTLKLLSATPVFAPHSGIYSHRIGDQWLAGGASNTGGAVLANEFTRDQIVQYTEQIDPAVLAGLNYYPLPKAGERFPVNDPDLQPRMSPRPDDDRVYFQAILEGIAAVEALGYRRLAELGASPLRSIRTVGGGAVNDKWTAIRLQRLGVPAVAPASEHAAMGTARLAWRGIGHEN